MGDSEFDLLRVCLEDTQTGNPNALGIRDEDDAIS
jgi:hypothetical protein